MGTTQNRILAPLDAGELTRRGLISDSRGDGTRMMHKGRLNRSSDEENTNISLDVLLQSPEASNAFVSIPDELISRATLTYLGFSEDKADALWDTWQNWPSTSTRRETDADDGRLRMTFIHFITGIFHTSDTTSEDDTEWKAVMAEYGLSVELKTAIMEPSFKYLRLSNSCAFWARDSIEMRYAGLEEIQAASMERERGIRRAASRPDHGEEASQSSTAQGRGSVSGLHISDTLGI